MQPLQLQLGGNNTGERILNIWSQIATMPNIEAKLPLKSSFTLRLKRNQCSSLSPVFSPLYFSIATISPFFPDSQTFLFFLLCLPFSLSLCFLRLEKYICVPSSSEDRWCSRRPAKSQHVQVYHLV